MQVGRGSPLCEGSPKSHREPAIGKVIEHPESLPQGRSVETEIVLKVKMVGP